jgi:hypothetical protein
MQAGASAAMPVGVRASAAIQHPVHRLRRLPLLTIVVRLRLSRSEDPGTSSGQTRDSNTSVALPAPYPSRLSPEADFLVAPTSLAGVLATGLSLIRRFRVAGRFQAVAAHA